MHITLTALATLAILGIKVNADANDVESISYGAVITRVIHDPHWTTTFVATIPPYSIVNSDAAVMSAELATLANEFRTRKPVATHAH